MALRLAEGVPSTFSTKTSPSKWQKLFVKIFNSALYSVMVAKRLFTFTSAFLDFSFPHYVLKLFVYAN